MNRLPGQSLLAGQACRSDCAARGRPGPCWQEAPQSAAPPDLGRPFGWTWAHFENPRPTCRPSRTPLRVPLASSPCPRV